MPTAAKLIAGLTLAITAAVAAYVFIQTHQDINIGPRFIAGNSAVGFFVGWFSLGRNYGYSNLSGIASGLRTLVFLLISCGFVLAAYFVFSDINRHRFQDPTEVPLMWIEKTFDYVVLALSVDVMIALAIGGAISGLCTYQAGIRWR